MWSNKRTAGTQLGWAGLPAVLFLFTLLVGHVQAADDDGGDALALRTAFSISGALEIDFFATKGNAYIVEGQIADGSWKRVHGPVYGTDEQVQEFISEEDRFQAFRLDVQSLADLGDAPMGLIGHAYVLNYGSKLTSLQFNSESTGVAEGVDGVDQVFSYTYEKTQPDIGQLVLNFGGTVGVESVVMEFERGRVGVFASTLSREGRRDFKSSGTFRSGADLSLPEAPLPLIGTRFVFRDRGAELLLLKNHVLLRISFGENAKGIFR
jgi:hypothetical protein